MKARRSSVLGDFTSTSTTRTSTSSSRAPRRAPLSDIRERLSNLKNTNVVESDSAASKPLNDILLKSVALAAAHNNDISTSSRRRTATSAPSNKESSASLDVDALLLRRAKRKELRESMRHLKTGDKVEAYTSETPKSKAHEADLPEPPSVRSTSLNNLSPPFSKQYIAASPQQQSLIIEVDQKAKSNALLYETGIKLKSAEERIDHLMKEMEELRMFANVSSQIQHDRQGQDTINRKQEGEILIESLQAENQQLLHEKSKLEATVETYQKQIYLRDQQIETMQSLQESTKTAVNGNSNDLQRNEEEYEIEIEAAQRQLVEMSRQLKDAQTRSQFLEEQLDETASNYTRSTKQMRASLEEAKKKIESLEADLDKAIDEKTSELYHRNKIEVDAIKFQYQDQIQQLHSEVESLKGKNLALEHSMQSKDLSIEKISKSLADAEIEWHSSQQQLRLLQSDKNNLQTKLQNSEMKVRQLTGDLRQREEIFENEMLSRCELLQHQHDEKYRTIEANCTNLEAELLSKEKELQEYQLLYEQIKQQNRDLVRKLEEVEKEKEGALIQSEETQSHLDEMKLDLEAVQCEMKRLVEREQHYNAIEKSHSKLQYELSTIKTKHDTQMNELETKLKEADQKYEKLQADFDVSERENDELAKAIEEIEEQNFDIEGIVEAYEKELDELKSSKEYLNLSLQQAEREKENLRMQVNVIQGENDSLLAKLSDNDHALQAFKREFGEKFMEMKDRYMEVERLYLQAKKELDQVHSDCSLAENKVRDLTAEINNLNAMNRCLQDDRNSLRKAVDLYKSKIIELETLSEQKRAELAKHEDELSVESRSLTTEMECIGRSSAGQSVKIYSARHRVFGIPDESSVSSSLDRERIEVDALNSYMVHRQFYRG